MDMSEEDSASARRWSPLQAAARPCTALGLLLRGPTSPQGITACPTSKAGLIPLPTPLPPLQPHASHQRGRRASARFSTREGVPLLQATDGTKDVLVGVPTIASLALRGVCTFEREWPHLITQVDGRLSAITQSAASRLVGRSVSSLFENDTDKDAVFMCGACANPDTAAWFAFQGAIKSTSVQMVVGPVIQQADGKRLTALLELVALPLQDPPQRGAVIRYETSGAPNMSPHQHVDAVLAQRLGASGRACEQDDHSTAIEVSSSDESDEDDAALDVGGLLQGRVSKVSGKVCALL
mmetsp:Transcript_4091/g.9773  ORF Transcript_4091/g.9773 Transcript_4091/m.9773 type:complete len:296 (+) Transcript_4091:103-990(+)